MKTSIDQDDRTPQKALPKKSRSLANCRYNAHIERACVSSQGETYNVSDTGVTSVWAINGVSLGLLAASKMQSNPLDIDDNKMWFVIIRITKKKQKTFFMGLANVFDLVIERDRVSGEGGGRMIERGKVKAGSWIHPPGNFERARFT